MYLTCFMVACLLLSDASAPIANSASSSRHTETDCTRRCTRLHRGAAKRQRQRNHKNWGGVMFLYLIEVRATDGRRLQDK